ncbi:MAG: hypothetical protein JNM19_00220 [Chitinophagaceae bacterium]|nr:hypothetical protein [Chitinophagaceae bacterium]
MSENQSAQHQEEKKEDVISEYYDGVKKLELQGYETGIKKARTALFVTAGLLLLGEILTASMSGIEWTPLMIGIVVIEVGIFIALGFWTKTKPYSAIITGLVLFILYWIAGIAINGFEAAYKGIFVKIIIIVYLAQAIKPAKAWEDTKRNR